MMQPRWRLTMWRAARRAHKKTPVRLTASTAFQSLSSSSKEGWRMAMPALFTRQSICPVSATSSSIAAVTAASSLTSTPQAWA